MATRIGVDVGGTFTDLVIYDDETGEVHVAKGPSTPSAPEAGVMDVVHAAVTETTLARARYFLHGTTVGINALLERKGARVGLLTTKGFRDVLELRRGTRESMYDLRYQPRPALVPRRLRVGIDERILVDGTVQRSLNPDDVAAAVELFAAEEVEAVAVCFINAYVDPQHELEAERLLREHGFEGAIALSHRLSRELREFERTATSVVDAYVRPAVSTYLRRLDEGLRAGGFAGESLITRSGGGSMAFAEAEGRPFETVMSGPVAGAVGAGALARALELPRAITADVGGTSFDTCLLLDGWPLVKYEGKVADLPLQTPWVDVRSIGAGGGSIAYADGDLLRVGPHSSGAVPGPVCYSRGGTQPTTTDAAAVLGMLAFGELAGHLRLDVPAAEEAITALGGELGLARDEAAAGVIAVAAAAMAGAVRSVSLEQGEDPRDAALIAYGGAGPLLATIIAEELDITTIVVPEHAGNFSACGLLDQELTRTASATIIRPLDADGLAAARETLAELRGALDARSAANGGTRVLEAALDLRYRGQLYTLTIPWAEAGDSAELGQAFARQYEKSFGHTLDAPVEIVAVRATLREPLPPRGSRETAPAVGGSQREIDAYSFRRRERVPFAVRDRAALPAEPVAGPMILLEPTATTYVDDGCVVRRAPLGALIVEVSE
jgi:N-methylhydantoinase A